MTEELLFSDEFAEIKYFPEANTIYLGVIGKLANDDYKLTFNKLLEFILEKKAKGVITDQTKSDGASMESRAWLIVKWLPDLKAKINNPDFKIAGVSNSKMGLKKFISQYLESTFKKLTPFPIETFDKVEDALKWIQG